MLQLGMQPRQRENQLAYKPTPRNLRYFSDTPYARRSINAYKNTISQLDWEIVVKPGFTVSDELIKQIIVVQNCFEHPNDDDNFSQLLEQVVEDMCCGAGAIEQEVGGNPLRPLWMWPVDGLSIQIYPLWAGDPSEARYAQMLGYGTASGASVAAYLRNDQLIYIRPNPKTSTPFGLGPLEVAFNSVSRILGVGDFAGRVSSNSKPNGMLHLGDVDDEHVKAFRVYWKNDIEGRGVLPISGGGEAEPKFIPLHPDGDNALYLKYQDFLKREIAIAFDLSPQNLGVESDINRNTSEVAEDRDMKQAIAPFSRKLGRALTNEAIHGRLGFHGLEFRFKGLDPENELDQANVFKIEYSSNAETPNGYRERRGMPRLENPWADLCYADAQIAIIAARGASAIASPDKGEFDPLEVVPKESIDNANQKGQQAQDRVDTSRAARPPLFPKGGGNNATRIPKKT